jgi:exosortase
MMSDLATITEPKAEAGPLLPRLSTTELAVMGTVVAALAWASWPAFTEMFKTWSDDPRYSHGFLVPLFAAYLLYHRRNLMAGKVLKPSWIGLPFLLVGAALKLVGGRYFIVWFDGISLLPTLVGLCLLLGGRSVFRWAWPAIGFLFFMIPLPYRIENSLGPPLQRMATLVSTYILQTFGLPAQAEGNVINLEDVKIGVVEACNGLGMLMMFFAYATAVAMVIRRPLLDRVIIVLSAAPIAMIANILRIATTGLLHAFSTRAIADHVYHDLAGYLMMPMALAMFGAELFVLSKLFREIADDVATPEPRKAMSMRPGSPLLIDVRSIRPATKKKPGR